MLLFVSDPSRHNKAIVLCLCLFLRMVEIDTNGLDFSYLMASILLRTQS